MTFNQLKTKQKILTALPVFLIGLGITGGCLIAGGACYEIPSWRLYTGIVFGGLIALFIGIVGVYGLIKKLPDWSIIWISVSMIGFLVPLNFVSSFGLPSVAEIVVLVVSIIIAFTLFYLITKKSWQQAGLFGIGLSTALTLILFFMATNVSHNEIKLGYFDLALGLVMTGLIFLYLKSNTSSKIFTLLTFVLLNSLMIFIFNRSMLKINGENQLFYLIFFSNGLLFSGIVFHYLIRWTSRLVKKP